MPTYVITAPDGKEYEVDAPEGASEQDVLAYAQQNYALPKPAAQGEWDYNPTSADVDGVTRQVGGAVDALQHRLTDLPLGIAQLAGNAVNSGVQAVAGDTEWGRGVNERNAALNRQVREREAAYQERTGDIGGSYVGSAVGQIAPWLLGIGAAKSAGLQPTLARTSQVRGVVGKAGNLAAKGGLLAAEGAAVGASAPVAEHGAYWDEKGRRVAFDAALAPVTALGLKGATAGIQGTARASRYLTPGGREAIANERLAGLLGSEPNILNTLASAPQYVPGEAPSLAQALQTPEALQIERSLRNNPQAGPAFALQDAENDAARMNVLRALAGTDADMTAALNTRRANADAYRKPNLPETGSPLVDPTSVVNTLTRLTNSSDPAVSRAARHHLGVLQRHMKANGGKVPAWDLDDLQQNVGSTLRQFAGDGAVTPKQVVRYEPVKTSILDALDGAVPGYRNYLAAYARDSTPINDMEAARGLVDHSSRSGLNVSGGEVVSLPQLLRTLRVNDKADFPMSPQAESQIEAVLKSRQRASISNNKVAASGPGTAAEVGATFLDSPMARVLSAGGAATAGTTALGPVGGILALLATEGAGAARRDITRRVGEKAASAPRTLKALMQAEEQRKKATGSGVPTYLLPWNPR